MGPLGGSFWLKYRLKIGQEPPRPLLEYFFSAPGPFPGPFGGPSGSFRGLLKNNKPQEGPRKAQNDPPGGARKAPGEPQMLPPGGAKLARKKHRKSKANGSEEPREATLEKLNNEHISNDVVYSARLSGINFASPLRLSGSQALRASAGCAKRKQFP